MKRLLLMLFSVILLISCDNNLGNIIDNNQLSDEISKVNTDASTKVKTSKEEANESSTVEATETSTEEENESSTRKETETSTKEISRASADREGSIEYLETITVKSIFQYDEDKAEQAKSMSYETIASDLDVYKYYPRSSDTINYLSQASSFELGESLSHKGFQGLEVIYDKKQYMWDDFFGELDVTEFSRKITINLKGNSIYESDIVDEYEKYYRYFNENYGLYYEVSDLMIGNFTDSNNILTNQVSGLVCNYKAIEGLLPPTYNPLIPLGDESGMNFFITIFDERPCVYKEFVFKDKLYKRWIDIEYGLVIKELIFNRDGFLESKTVASSIVKKDIDDLVFEEPENLDYKDISLFIFIAEGGNVDILTTAMYDYFPQEAFGIRLTSDDSQVTLYTTGLSQMTPSVDDVIYVSNHTDSQGVTSRIRHVVDERFYTIHDGMEIVEIYDKSCYEKKFFNFDDVGLLQVKETEKGMIYSFYDTNNISVSALYDVYEYVIEDDQIKTINTYEIETIKDIIPIGEVKTYTYEIIELDESVYDESCMETYKIIDHGEGSFNDGEHKPFWYE